MSGEKYFEVVSLYLYIYTPLHLYISTYLHPQQQFKITTHGTSGMLQQLPPLWEVKMVVKTVVKMRYAVDAVVISAAGFTTQASWQALRDLYTHVYLYLLITHIQCEW